MSLDCSLRLRRFSLFSSALRFFSISRRRFSIVFWFLGTLTSTSSDIVLVRAFDGTAMAPLRKGARTCFHQATVRDVLVASAATATAAASTSTTASVFTRLRFIHGQRATIVHAVVQPVDSGLGLGVRIHFDESKPLAAPGVPIRDHQCISDLTKLAKQLFKVGGRNLVAQIAAIELLSQRFSPI